MDEKVKQSLYDNISIERLAGILYYSIYAPEKYPNYDKYNEHQYEEFINDNFPELNILGILKIKQYLVDKLEEINHPKAGFLREMEEIFSYYNVSKMNGLLDLWYSTTLYQLSMNRYHTLDPFPVLIWYRLKKTYKNNHRSYRQLFDKHNIKYANTNTDIWH